MLFFRKRKERRTVEEDELIKFMLDFLSLQGNLKAYISEDLITKEVALNIPSVKACVELISNTIASIPIYLYELREGKKYTKEDDRVTLLNNDTGDTLNGFQIKKALVIDYLLEGNGYAYINKEKNKVKSLHYVNEKEVSINIGIDPIFKSFDINVNGVEYRPYEFIKLLKNTQDGATGSGILKENKKILAATYNSLVYENLLSKTGGNKKGFIKADGKLDEKSMALLKQQWKNMYSENSENCVILNKGLDFKESSATPTELQINENKITNSSEICKIFNVPVAMLTGDGKENNTVYETYVKTAILPILKAFEATLNKDLLLEKEKKSFYFAFDTKELLKGDIEKRFRAYEIGLKNSFLSVNEVRFEEDREAIAEFEDVVKLGLQDVLYNTKNGSIYTPNTDKTTKLGKNINSNLKGGEIDETGNKE